MYQTRPDDAGTEVDLFWDLSRLAMQQFQSKGLRVQTAVQRRNRAEESFTKERQSLVSTEQLQHSKKIKYLLEVHEFNSTSFMGIVSTG